MTNLQNCLDSRSIYVGTYAKYNNGSLYGKWLDLADYSDYDELLETMKEYTKTNTILSLCSKIMKTVLSLRN